MNFKERLLESLKRIFSSMKVMTALSGLLVAFLAKRGIILSPDDANSVIMVFAVLVGAQGLNDFGKGKQ